MMISGLEDRYLELYEELHCGGSDE
jgi:hypothetical protein